MSKRFCVTGKRIFEVNSIMVKIDWITGFLGSGKTTFIKKYAKHLIDKGDNIESWKMIMVRLM